MPGRARDVHDGGRARRIRVVPFQHRQLVDGHVAGRQLHRLAGSRHLVGTPPGDLDRAVDGRHLAQRAGHPGQGRLDRRAGDRRALDRRAVAVDVVRRGGLAEADRGPVPLRRAEVVLHQARRAPEEHGQHAGRERVERPAVAHAARGREPADQPHDVVRGGAGRLGDDEDAVEATAAVARAHRRTSPAMRSATSRTRRSPPRAAGRPWPRPRARAHRRRTSRSGRSRPRRRAWCGPRAGSSRRPAP